MENAIEDEWEEGFWEDDSNFEVDKPQSCYKDGKPRVLTRQCKTCIFRPGNKMSLKAGRLKDMINAANREGSQGVVCHDTLSYGPFPDYGGALCRGYYDLFGHLNNFVRIIGRIGGFAEVDPPGSDEEDTADNADPPTEH